MASVSASISPHVNTVVTTATSISIFNVQVALFTGASCQVNMYGSSGAFIGTTQTQLTPAQYQTWNTNDAYFVSAIASNLGFSGATGTTASTQPERLA